MRFWDSSAIVTLVMNQPRSPMAHDLLSRDADMVVWWATPVECWSALSRLEREGAIRPADADAAAHRLQQLSEAWYEISAAEEVRLQARRLLRVHMLRSADALQLAAALVWSGLSDSYELVTFDERLRDAARREGFLTIS